MLFLCLAKRNQWIRALSYLIAKAHKKHREQIKNDKHRSHAASKAEETFMESFVSFFFFFFGKIILCLLELDFLKSRDLLPYSLNSI